MKLSAAQQKVMDRARLEIQQARESADVNDYYVKYKSKYHRYNTLNDLMENCPEAGALVEKWYNLRLQGITLCQASGPTIHKLEKLGYIKILKDTTGTGSYRFDKIQVLEF